MEVNNPVYKKPITVLTAPMNMQLSPDGKKFLKSHEGFKGLWIDKHGVWQQSLGIKPDKINLTKWVKTNPYEDSQGYATAGYGRLLGKRSLILEDIQKYKDQTEAEASKYLDEDISRIVAAVNKIVRGIPLKQYQFDAIVSFAFNVGPGDPPNKKHPGLLGSEFLRQLKKGTYDGRLMMNFSKQKEIKRRRQDEVNLFIWGVYTHIDQTQLIDMLQPGNS